MITKINSALPAITKIEQLNDMILELNGLMSKGKFDINELVQIYSDISLDRKYKRDVLLGNTVDDYTGWAHLKSETGFSIWKYPVTNYTYNAVNELYLDNMILDNRGEASSESALTFDSVLLDDGEDLTDVTTEISTENDEEVTILEDTDSYIYIGASDKFNGVKVDFKTRASNITLKLEYYNGVGWATLTVNSNGLSDNTNNFLSNGYINWDTLNDWQTVDIGELESGIESGVESGQDLLYYIRISTTTLPITAPEVYYMIPYNSVVGLLAMSSTQVFNQQWAWCYYNGYIYVTIRNTGNTAYEGDYYITSSSSDTNKRNYFIYNHSFETNHEDSTYSNTGLTLNQITLNQQSAPSVVEEETSVIWMDVDGSLKVKINAGNSGDPKTFILVDYDQSGI